MDLESSSPTRDRGSLVRPPGDFIRAELEQRGWSQADLASIIRRPLPTINEIIQGKRAIMPEMAVGLGVAFGTGPEIWMQRESEYRLSLVAQDDPAIQRRARLYEIAPIKEMQLRGWINAHETEEIEEELCSFFGVLTLDEEPQLQAAARQTFRADEFTAAQRAWALQAARLARLLNARPFDQETFVTGLSRIRSLADVPEKARHIPRLDQMATAEAAENLRLARRENALTTTGEQESTPSPKVASVSER